MLVFSCIMRINEQLFFSKSPSPPQIRILLNSAISFTKESYTTHQAINTAVNTKQIINEKLDLVLLLPVGLHHLKHSLGHCPQIPLGHIFSMGLHCNKGMKFINRR